MEGPGHVVDGADPSPLPVPEPTPYLRPLFLSVFLRSPGGSWSRGEGPSPQSHENDPDPRNALTRKSFLRRVTPTCFRYKGCHRGLNWYPILVDSPNILCVTTWGGDVQTRPGSWTGRLFEVHDGYDDQVPGVDLLGTELILFPSLRILGPPFPGTSVGRRRGVVRPRPVEPPLPSRPGEGVPTGEFPVRFPHSTCRPVSYGRSRESVVVCREE